MLTQTPNSQLHHKTFVDVSQSFCLCQIVISGVPMVTAVGAAGSLWSKVQQTTYGLSLEQQPVEVRGDEEGGSEEEEEGLCLLSPDCDRWM